MDPWCTFYRSVWFSLNKGKKKKKKESKESHKDNTLIKDWLTNKSNNNDYNQ